MSIASYHTLIWKVISNGDRWDLCQSFVQSNSMIVFVPKTFVQNSSFITYSTLYDGSSYIKYHVTSLKTDLVSFSQQCLFFFISVFFLTSFSPIEMQTCDTNFTHTATKISVVPKENSTLPYLCLSPLYHSICGLHIRNTHRLLWSWQDQGQL